MPRPEKKARRGKWWSWLGLGAVGVGAAVLAMTRRAEKPEVVDDLGADRFERADEATDPFVMPDDISESWVPGPAGIVRIAERHPDGELALIFVHGLGGRLEQWASQLSALPPTLRGIALDLPGHGGSDAEGDDLSISALAGVIGAVADALDLRRVVVVGHSLGASLAISWAADNARRVVGLFLVDPNGDQTRLDEKQRDGFVNAIRSDVVGELTWYFGQILIGSRPAVRERVLSDLEEADPEILRALVEHSVTWSPVAALDRYDGPVHSLISDVNDLEISLHRLLPDLPTSRVVGTGHWLMLDKPATTNRVLADFVDEVRDRVAGRRPVAVVSD